jgi:hypothetical protein
MMSGTGFLMSGTGFPASMMSGTGFRLPACRDFRRLTRR